jgi:hypothetical protein
MSRFEDMRQSERDQLLRDLRDMLETQNAILSRLVETEMLDQEEEEIRAVSEGFDGGVDYADNQNSGSVAGNQNMEEQGDAPEVPITAATESIPRGKSTASSESDSLLSYLSDEPLIFPHMRPETPGPEQPAVYWKRLVYYRAVTAGHQPTLQVPMKNLRFTASFPQAELHPNEGETSKKWRYCKP